MEKIYEIVRIKQVISETSKERYVVRNPESAISHAYDLIGEDDREVFLVMVLNTKNQVVAVHRCHVGSLNSSIVHPREVFKSAILNNGASIICVHQHPSGDPSASKEDVNVFKRLYECGNLLGIEILDFLILGEKIGNNIKYESFKEKGYF